MQANSERGERAETALERAERLIAETVQNMRPRGILSDGQRWRDYRAEQDRQRALGKSIFEASEIADRVAAEKSARRAEIVRGLHAGQYATADGIAMGGEFRGGL